jgi:hypothetical protein
LGCMEDFVVVAQGTGKGRVNDAVDDDVDDVAKWPSAPQLQMCLLWSRVGGGGEF